MGVARKLERVLLSGSLRAPTVAFAIYAGVTLVLWCFASSSLRDEHTAYNHYALLAQAWQSGKLALAGAPPAYTGGNDFAFYDGRWYVVFPPFPALLLLPAVWLAGGDATAVADGRIFLLLAGIAPAVLFLVFQELGRMGQSPYTERQHLLLSLLFAFGTVYFFSAVQGTVWYAAHVVGAGLASLYALWSLGAVRPLAAGVALGCAFLTRAPLLFALPLFMMEAWRVCRHAKDSAGRTSLRAVDVGRFARTCAWFSAPVLAALLLSLWHNHARFGEPLEFGYRFLEIRWQDRISEWGLFHYHYLAKNLGVILTALPWISKTSSEPAFQINAHGLALWITTPLYLWLLWPRRRPQLTLKLWVTTLCVALPTLFYQNTGWVQFGYRFSNDYAVFLFMLLALAGHRLGRLFYAAAAVSLVVNAFGALSFNRPFFRAYYYIDPTQRVLYQPD